MLNNQTNKLEYINKLENDKLILIEENRRLKQAFLSGCESYNIALLQKNMRIDALERELKKLRQQNAMLVLMR